MIDTRKLDLQLFAEGGDAGGGDGGSTAGIQVGDTLADGTVVDENLASSMREDADMYLANGQQADAQPQMQGMGNDGQQQAGGNEPAAPTREEWEEAKKKFATFYGEDVKGAVSKRFKNQADAGKQLESWQPVIDALKKKAGVEKDEELQKLILDDDSIYEEEAEAKGLTVEAVKQMHAQDERIKQLEAAEESAKNEAYIRDLIRQGMELKELYPDFDIIDALNNDEEFQRLTSPAVGLSVEKAFMALRGKDMMAQSMAYGVQAGKEQTAKAIQANAMRPVEGASRGGRTGGTMQPTSGAMSEEMYDRIRNRTMQGENVPL